MSDVYLYGPTGGVVKQVPTATTDLSNLADALGQGLSVTSSLGPGLPIGPSHPEERAPRVTDYMPGVNVTITPRGQESYSFDTLYSLAESWDVAGLCIGKRVEEFVRIPVAIQPRLIPNETQKQRKYRADSLRDEIADAMGFFETPDQQTPYDSWLARGLNDAFKGDCMTVYLRPNRGMGVYGAEFVNGRTIRPIIDLWGNIAQVPAGTERHIHEWSPGPNFGAYAGAGAGIGMACSVCGAAPAFAQVIKGMNWTWYGSDEIIYAPRFPYATRPGSIPHYGHPPLEWVILSVNRALRRQSLDLANYTEGALPLKFLKIPEGWTLTQAQEFLTAAESLLRGNDRNRVALVPIPGGANSGLEDGFAEPKTEAEEYLLHIGCAAFAVSPMEIGFIRSSGGAGLGGKGVAESQTDQGRLRQMGLASHMARVYNRILAAGWSSDLVAYFPTLVEPKDRLIEAQTLAIYMDHGVTSADWVAESVLEQDPPGLPNYISTPQGPVLVSKFVTSGTVEPEPATMAPTPSALPGVNTEAAPVEKALGGGKLDFKGDVGKVAYRQLLRSYPPDAIEWATDPGIKWEYDPSVKLAEVKLSPRPGQAYEDKIKEIAASIANGASLEPCILVEFAEPDPLLTIADGRHRTGGVAMAGEDKFPALVAHNVPNSYRSAITGEMQDESHDIAKELGLWRRKAIKAVKLGKSAAVPFRSEVIPAPVAVVISAALATAHSPADVWAIFGEGAA